MKRGFFAFVVVALIAATMATLVLPQRAQAAEGEIKLTVGPLVNYGGNGTYVMYADGKPAFCTQPDIPTPAAGTYKRSDLDLDDEDVDLLRAVLYYGAGAPGQDEVTWPLFEGLSGQTDFQIIWADTHLLAAYVWSGSIDNALHEVEGVWQERREWFLYNLFGIDDSGKVTNKNATLQQIKRLVDKVPDSFYVYQVTTGRTTQTLVSWTYTTDVLLTKKSANTNTTQGNNAYQYKGARFEIRRVSDNALITTVTTDAKGTASFQVPPGTRYYAVEVAAPAGFKLDSSKHEFNASDGEVTITIKDEPARLSLTLHKADAATGGAAQAGATLKGAEYQLTDANGTVHTASSDANGTLVFNKLPLGTVTVVETKAPAGYQLDTAVHTYRLEDTAVHDDIALKPSEPLTEVPVAFNLELTKYLDTGNEGSGLQNAGAGVVFNIVSNTTNNVVGSITTDEHGHATTQGQWFGSGSKTDGVDGALPYDAAGYTLKEDPSTTPAGYRAAESWTIEPNQMVNGVTLHYIVDNDFVASRIQVVKVDADTGAPIPLAGFTFQLLDSNKKPITQKVWYPNEEELQEFTTDDSGTVTFPEALKVGTYYLREVKTPKPYLVASDDVKVVISDDADVPPVTVVTVADTRPTGTATITKTCTDDGKALAGATFDVVAQETITAPDGTVDAVEGSVVAQVTTGDDGTASAVDLPLGTGSAQYAFVETTPPVEHALDAEPLPFTLTYHDAHTSVVFSQVDAKNKPTTIKLSKAIMGTDDALPGAVFKLWRADEEHSDDAATTITIEKDGTAAVDHLEPGTYCLQETKAPAGYLVDDTIHTIIIDENGLIDGNAETTVALEDDYTKVDISKRDITNEKEVPGATLSVLDAHGNKVETWTSTEEDHRINALPPGSYTLVETMTPNSYDETTEVSFTVEETGEIQRVAMYDEPITITGQIDKRQEIADPTAPGTEADTGKARAAVRISDDGSYDYAIDFRNTSSTWVDEFTVTDELNAAREGTALLTGITTPAVVGDYDGLMNVWYQTNATAPDSVDKHGANATLSDGHENPWLTHEAAADVLGDDGRRLDYTGWRLWKADVSTTKPQSLDVSDLKLADDEHVTALRFEFGRVEEGCTSRRDGWDRKDLKDAHDDVDNLASSYSEDTKHNDAGVLAGAIVHMRVTDAYQDGVALRNTAKLDLFRNGGDLDDTTQLEDHDRDAVEQTPRTVLFPLAQTDVHTIIPALITAGGITLIGIILANIWTHRRR